MSDHNITQVSKMQCTGCGACIQSCPQKAITFICDEEGFPSPSVNLELCVDCGLCVGFCPAMCPPATNKVIRAFAAQIKDEEALMKSSSGGLFTAFARAVFEQNGAVYGCVWDDEYNAYIKKATSEVEIDPMRGSKYVWSWAGGAFPDIKADLESGHTVLFTGLPCQAAGLKNYLRHDYSNLFIVDFLCSGSPSPMVFHKWLETINPLDDKSNLNLHFRDKTPYGVGVHITYSGQKKQTSPRGDAILNSYYYSFYSHLIDRMCCYNCPYGTDNRISDITISDYWGIEKWYPELDTKTGFSAMLINTEKGAGFFEDIKDNLFVIPTEVEKIAKANNLSCENVKKKARSIPAKRSIIIQKTRDEGWRSAEKHLNDRVRFKKIIIAKTPLSVIRLIKKILKRP